jgi:sensor histidine kinase regulating citrate/malate metabolism
MKMNHYNRLVIQVGLILTTIYAIVSIGFILTEFNYVQDNTKRLAIEMANVYTTDEALINGIETNESNLIQYISPTFYTSEQLSYFAIYGLDQNLLANSALYDETLACDDAFGAYNGDTVLCESKLISKDSLRVYVPIESDEDIIGIFAIGVDGDTLWHQKVDQIERILIIFIIGIVSSWGGLWLFSKKSQGGLLGYQPNEIALLYSENKSLIDQLEQSVISVDVNCKITTINPMGMHMFSLTEEDIGKDIKDVFPYVRLSEIIQNQEHIEDEYIQIAHHKLIMNVFTLYQGSNVIGATVIFRSYLEVDTLINQIKGYQQIASALRSQKHEFQNKLHVILGLIKMKDYLKAEQYITENVYKTNLASDYYTSRIKDDRVLALFIGKETQCTEKGIHLLLTSDSFLGKDHAPITADDIILVLGNLIDNSCDAYQKTKYVDKKVVVDIIEDDEQLMITVIDQAGGIDPSVIDRMFERGVSTKLGDARGTGLSLVNEIIRLYDGTREVSSSIEETKIEVILSKVKL